MEIDPLLLLVAGCETGFWVLLVAGLGARYPGLTALVAGTGVPDLLAWSADPLWSWGARIAPVVAIWFAIGPLWATLAPRERSGA